MSDQQLPAVCTVDYWLHFVGCFRIAWRYPAHWRTRAEVFDYNCPRTRNSKLRPCSELVAGPKRRRVYILDWVIDWLLKLGRLPS